MKSGIASCLLSLLLIVDAAAPCFGQKKANDDAMTVEQIKANDDAMTVEQIKARVGEAKGKDKRLIVLLKNGSSVSGLVSPDSDSTFSVTETHGIFGDGNGVTTLHYSDVSRVKGRNPFVKALKDIGAVSAAAVAMAAFLPFWAALEGLSLLLNGEPLPSCSIVN
jgi:hypothetical protein